MQLNPQKDFYYAPDGTGMSDDCTRLRELVGQPWFKRALTHTLASMAMRLPATPLQQQACDTWNQLVGARYFVDILLNLGERDKATETDKPRLHYEAYNP